LGHYEDQQMKTSRVRRIIEIITALQSAQHYAVCDLARMFGTSRRTVFRDLRDLQEAGVPCYYDSKTRSYAIDPKFCLPASNLSTRETLGLLLLAHKARNHIHFPLKESALRAILKIESNLAGKVKQFCNRALGSITIKEDPQVRISSLDSVFVQLIEAILKKRIVNIRYDSPRERKSVVLDLEPYHLLHSQYTWHVLGRSGGHRGVRAFKLNRIKELHVLEKCFTEDKKFDLQEHLGRAWSMLPEGRLYHVKLRFLPEVANNVAEVQWHDTQTAIFGDDGSVTIEFRVDGLSEITWWILSYGDRVQVLAPEILRRKIVEIAQNTVKQNKQLLRV